MGPLIPIFWTSGDIYPECIRSLRVFSPVCKDSSDSPLVQHLLTSWWSAWQPSLFDPCILFKRLFEMKFNVSYILSSGKDRKKCSLCVKHRYDVIYHSRHPFRSVGVNRPLVLFTADVDKRDCLCVIKGSSVQVSLVLPSLELLPPRPVTWEISRAHETGISYPCDRD